MSQWDFWWDGGIEVLTGEAASPEHVLGDTLLVTHFEWYEKSQWLENGGKEGKEEVKFDCVVIVADHRYAKPNWAYLGCLRRFTFNISYKQMNWIWFSH
jgi:hypothetical protein